MKKIYKERTQCLKAELTHIKKKVRQHIKHCEGGKLMKVLWKEGSWTALNRPLPIPTI
jgi:hypothetical protein